MKKSPSDMKKSSSESNRVGYIFYGSLIIFASFILAISIYIYVSFFINYSNLVDSESLYLKNLSSGLSLPLLSNQANLLNITFNLGLYLIAIPFTILSLSLFILSLRRISVGMSDVFTVSIVEYAYIIFVAIFCLSASAVVAGLQWYAVSNIPSLNSITSSSQVKIVDASGNNIPSFSYSSLLQYLNIFNYINVVAAGLLFFIITGLIVVGYLVKKESIKWILFKYSSDEIGDIVEEELLHKE